MTCKVNFPKFPETRNRKGSPADRGRVVKFPEAAAQARPKPSWSLSRVGPGIVTGAANLDPSAVVTATIAGAAFAHSLFWVVVLVVPFLLAIFSVTSRIGVQTGQGLLDLVRENYGRKFALAGAVFTIATNLAVVIADIMAVSDAFSILTGLSRMFFIAATAFFVWYILVFQDYQKITRALVLLSLPLYLYVAAAVLTSPNVGGLLHDIFIPKMQATSEYAENIVALFGSFLTPYIIIWQTSSRSDPEHEHHQADSILSTAVTFVLACSIMLAASAVLHFSNAPDMTTRQAAEALRPAVGDWGPTVFAIGIIGSGMVALPVLVASMCFDLAQAVGWKSGLSEKPWEAKRFYVLISAAVFVAAGANYMRINPVTALYWSMILAGVLLIPTLIFILVISNDRRIMRTVNSRWQNFWLGAAAGGAAAAGLIYMRYKVF
ncbi:MAG: divalent metal cation transporter [Acidobacteria bacterium]|nr:divalent metal cation transporter [Acidobacteriota bacterium]MBV9144649.1 divalent metal cation transporter [Acidobacteriota bacterium]MBV9437654.1 divalent metal cation transporter [Acidobacteriota bacterium]